MIMFSHSLQWRQLSIRLGVLGNGLAKDHGYFKVPFMKYCNPSGSLGRGAGKGGGAGGSVRESGGGLGEYGAAQEEMFFYNKQKEQLEKIKKKMKEDEGIQQKGDDK